MLGAACGIFLGDYAASLSWVGDAFIGLLQMTVLPYIIVALISNIGRLSVAEGKRFGFYAGVFLLVSLLLTGGQQILTTTVEEKSSRVVEVLLSAVSPMQLMAGKIVGQLCVGMVMLVLYAGMGIAVLVSFTLLGFIDLSLLFYLLIF